MSVITAGHERRHRDADRHERDDGAPVVHVEPLIGDLGGRHRRLGAPSPGMTADSYAFTAVMNRDECAAVVDGGAIIPTDEPPTGSTTAPSSRMRSDSSTTAARLPDDER